MVGTSLRLFSFLCLTAFVVSVKRSYLTGKNPKALVDAENCFFDNQKTCYSCKNAALCIDSSGGMTAYDEPCYIAGEVCNIAADAVEAECTANPISNEPGFECFCNPSLEQPRTEADIYTDFAYILCDSDTTYYYSCFNGYVYSAEYDECSPEAPNCQFIGIFPFDDDCDFYYECLVVNRPGNVQKCPDNEYFNINVGRCDAIPDTTVTCYDEDDNPLSGTIPSPVYCNFYYVCDEGTFVSTESCGVDMIFSSDDKECITDDGTCQNTAYCF